MPSCVRVPVSSRMQSVGASRRRYGPFTSFAGLGFAAAIACAGGTPLAAAEPAVLTVQASGFALSGGHAIAKLFQPGDNILGKGRWQSTTRIANGRAQFQFRHLPAGSYAVVVFHDENDNGTIDHGPLGPSEPLGFSNGFTLGLISGLPTFEKLQFPFNGSAQTLNVTVR